MAFGKFQWVEGSNSVDFDYAAKRGRKRGQARTQPRVTKLSPKVTEKEKKVTQK